MDDSDWYHFLHQGIYPRTVIRLSKIYGVSVDDILLADREGTLSLRAYPTGELTLEPGVTLQEAIAAARVAKALRNDPF